LFCLYINIKENIFLLYLGCPFFVFEEWCDKSENNEDATYQKLIHIYNIFILADNIFIQKVWYGNCYIHNQKINNKK